MSEKSIIQAVVRPKKVAALISYGISEDDFRDLQEFLGELWGGKYSCIVPFDPTDADNELGISWLKQYSPDVVLCASDSCNKKWMERIQEDINPLQILPLRYPLSENFQVNQAGILSCFPVVTNYAKDVHSLPDTRTRFQFISTDSEISNRVFYDLSFGVHSEEDCEGLAKYVRAESLHVTDGSIPNFIKLHDNEQNPFTYLDISTLELDTVNAFESAPTIFVLSRSIVDYAWFWNSRSNYGGGANNCLAVPLDSLGDKQTITALASWLTGYHRGKPNYCEIKSISASKDELNGLARKLRPRVKKFGYEYVDVMSADKKDIPSFQVQHKQHDIDAVWMDDQSFEFTAPVPSFVDEIPENSSSSWVVEVKGGSKLKSHIPPRVCFQTNTKLLNTPSPASPSYLFRAYSRRYLSGHIAVACNRKSVSKKITLPTPEELLMPFLQKVGIKRNKDEKQLCYETVIGLFGGLLQFIECCKHKRDEIILSLRADKALPVSMHKIKQQAKLGRRFGKPFQDSNSFQFVEDPLVKKIAEERFDSDKGFYRRITPQAFISWLVEATITRQLFHYPQCPSCENKSEWVSKIDLGHPLYCSRCGSRIFAPGDKFDLGYQLNPIVNKAFEEGIRPVALTLGVLKKSSNDGFQYIPGFKGRHENQDFDIDIVAICDGELVFCECKSMESVPENAKVWRDVQSQLTGLIEKGHLCGARSVVLASLANEYPKPILKMAKDKSSSDMRVVLLNKEDLLRGYVKSKRSDMDKYPATLNEAFLPQLPKGKGKRRKGNRTVSFGGMKVSK